MERFLNIGNPIKNIVSKILESKKKIGKLKKDEKHDK